MKNIIEISKKTAKAGRVPIKFVLHEIYGDTNSYNSNGICWQREYAEQNLDSVKGMPLVCQFADEDNEIPFGAHGEMSSKDGDVVFEDSLVVGSFDDAYIDDNIEINGKTISGLIGAGYIYSQRFPSLVDYLQEQHDNDISVESSVEICADKSKGNSKIIYDGGWKEKGRIPKDYQYSGQALCIGVEPADNTALMIELNSAFNKNKIVKTGGEKKLARKKINASGGVEINELSYEDISILISRAFNAISNLSTGSECYNNYYYVYKLYPETKRAIFTNYNSIPRKYYMAEYSIENDRVNLNNVISVEEDWKPSGTEQEAEINTSLIQSVISGEVQTKEGENKMDEKVMLELNEKLAGKTIEISNLQTENQELKTKSTEQSEVIVNANKTIEELNAEIESLKTELNACKEEVNSYKEKETAAEAEQKKVEVNSYFNDDIMNNGFSEEEINSLKHFIDEVDLAGLKSAEAEICTKKLKELNAGRKEKDVETNSSVTFISIHEREKKKIGDSNVRFFD